MDYLKFAAISWSAFVAFALGLHTGSNAIAFFVLAMVTLLIAKYRPKAHTIGFIIWVLLIAGGAVLVWLGIQDQQTRLPEKWTPEHAANVSGFANVLFGFVLQPLCYWLGRAGVKLTRSSSQASPVAH